MSFALPRLLLFIAVPAAIGIALNSLTLDPMSIASLRASAQTFPQRTALVVGGTAGLGHGIAVRLAQANMDVTIAGRSEEAGKKVVAEMDASGPGKHDFKKLDASLMSNVKAFTEEFKREKGKLDVLVLTQGIATLQGRTETSEGTDVKMTLHYCGFEPL